MRLQENAEWVQENFAGCELGHVRRVERLAIVATNMLESPESSLPQQNCVWSDLKAAYRLCDRKEVTFDAVAGFHWKQTRQTRPGRYLLICDTTDIDHTRHNATTSLSFIGDGLGRGMQLHSCLMVDSSRDLIEGHAGALVYYRKHVPPGETRMQRLRRSRESELWGRLVDKVGPPPAGSQWIHVFDRGGDHFEALCHLIKNHCDWVIRAAKMNRKVFDQCGKQLKLSELITQAKELGSYELHLRSRRGQAARIAHIRVSTTRATLPRPKHRSKYVTNCGVTQVETNIVIVQEVGAPVGIKPICWVLLTSLPVTTFEGAWQIIDDYEHRWLIEEYHKVLKTGCSIERHALRTAGRLEALMGLISIIGVRLLQLKTFAKQEPEAKASNRVPSMWLKVLTKMRPRLQKVELTVHQFWRELAKLGGFLGRKHDGEPGWQTLWRGFHKLQACVQAIRLVLD